MESLLITKEQGWGEALPEKSMKITTDVMTQNSQGSMTPPAKSEVWSLPTHYSCQTTKKKKKN